MYKNKYRTSLVQIGLQDSIEISINGSEFILFNQFSYKYLLTSFIIIIIIYSN